MLCPTGRWKTDVQNPAVRTVQKEVINCCDCKKLGYIDDLIIDDCKGCIEALVVSEGGKWCNFFGDGTEYIIPFSCIKRIGPDLILVEIHEEK